MASSSNNPGAPPPRIRAIRPRLHTGGGNNVGVDRISNLLDVEKGCEIYANILSRLTTRDAFRTCILSKKWQNLWKLAKTLDFTERDFHLPLLQGDIFHLYSYLFKEMVFSVLDNWEQFPIDRFSLTSQKTPYTNDCFRKCLRLVPRLSPRIVHFQFPFPAVPHALFECRSIEMLVLNYNHAFRDDFFLDTHDIKLPKLRVLKLVRFRLEDAFMEQLFAGCPNLEEMELEHCKLRFGPNEKPPNLKRFSIRPIHYINRLTVCCPKLVTMNFPYPDDFSG